MAPGRIFFAAIALYAQATVPVRAEIIQVVIDKLVFVPAEVTAKVGDTIEWVNKDALAHTATEINGNWNLVIAPKQSGRIVLKKSGAVEYFCKYHPNMKGSLAVDP